MDLGLSGKKALIAGGGRGIGKAIALELAREGVELVVASRTTSQLKVTADEITEKTGAKVVPITFDVTKRKETDRMVNEAIDKLGGVHILINSASLPGGSPSAVGPIETLDEDELLADFEVKYVGALRCARAVIPHMKQQKWGRIINISGTNSRKAGNLSGGARNTSLVHLTKTLAVQFGRFGITVNCIHPGATRTERTPAILANRAKELGLTQRRLEEIDYSPDAVSGNSIGRMVDASEIAYLTTFLVSNKAWAVTGELVVADGGAGNSVYY